MIDFRYLLITIVSIFLALTIGIAIGAGFLGEPLTRDLENRLDDVERQSDVRRAEIAELGAELENADAFASAAEPWLVQDKLAGRQIVLLSFDGVDGGMVDGLREVLESARAEVVSTITFHSKFRLGSDADREQLALVVQSIGDDAATVRADAADTIGRVAGAAAAAPVGVEADPASTGPLVELTDRLQRADFITIEGDGEQTVPAGAHFLLVAGSGDRAPFDVAAFAQNLGVALTGRDAHVMAAEFSESEWGVVQAIRNSGETSSDVSTVDQGEIVDGRVAVVLGMDRPSEEPAGHYGTADGATDVIPPPAE